MRRRVQDGGEAARAGAEDSVTSELLDITALVRSLAFMPGELRAERRTRAQDFAFFRKHPRRLTYLRAYHAGELPAPVIRAQPLGAPVRVAVGYVAPGERVRVYIWPGHSTRQALKWAETHADERRGALGLKGRA